MAYDNTNSGALFRNERKESDNHPDYTGSMNINGEDFWLSAWVNEAKQGTNIGKKFFSIKARPKNEAANQSPSQSANQASQKLQEPAPTYDDDIPF